MGGDEYFGIDIEIANKVSEFLKESISFTDEKGNVVKGNTFKVRSMDELGETYECSIKPSRPSDKALLNMLLK